MPRSPSRNDPFEDRLSWKKRGERRAPPKEYLPPDPPPFNFEQTLHWWKHVRSDDWWLSQMSISTKRLDLVFGYGELRAALNPNGEEKLDKALKRISTVIDDIESRRLCFPENKRGHLKIGQRRRPKFLWLEPQPKKIGKLVVENFWSLWAECITCGNNKFLPVTIDRKPHVACYHCIPPSQYPQIGAKRVEKSLIHEALKELC